MSAFPFTKARTTSCDFEYTAATPRGVSPYRYYHRHTEDNEYVMRDHRVHLHSTRNIYGIADLSLLGLGFRVLRVRVTVRV